LKAKIQRAQTSKTAVEKDYGRKKLLEIIDINQRLTRGALER
jgi:hypothetical protein